MKLEIPVPIERILFRTFCVRKFEVEGKGKEALGSSLLDQRTGDLARQGRRGWHILPMRRDQMKSEKWIGIPVVKAPQNVLEIF